VSSPELSCDVLVVGGGLVGSALANALVQLPIEIVLIESHDTAKLEQPSFDARASALANGSQRVLEALGLWSRVHQDAEPILNIHVSEQGRFGAVRISAAEERVEALGFTVENRVLGQAFWAKLNLAANFRHLAPAKLSGFEATSDHVSASVSHANGKAVINAKLMIAADGTHSGVRESLGIVAREDDYDQVAVICNCATETPLDGLALERFSPSGPLALLPLTRNRGAIVWTLPAGGAERVLELPEQQTANELQGLFGSRVGRIVRVGTKTSHKLLRVRSGTLARNRVVLIGNAAVSLHPVAGQGFNLALRDIAALAELLADAVLAHPEPEDLGDPALLRAYSTWRRRDQWAVAGFTHGLIRLFGVAAPCAGFVRGAGLLAFDVSPGAKAALARHTMGRAGRLPRLARGVPLIET
jgi:2-octaprenyl-6-methoxyphenol hydroxylase